MRFDPAEWGPPLAVMLGGLALGALFLRGRGAPDPAVAAEGKRDDLEANRAASIDALRQLELDRAKLDPDVYAKERDALLSRGAAAMRTLDAAAPAPADDDLLGRLRSERDRVGPAVFDAAIGQILPDRAPRPGIAPEWMGAGWATLACALIAVLAWMATSESVERRDGASMTGNQDLGGPTGGPPPEWVAAKAEAERKILADPGDLDAMNELTQLYLQSGEAPKAMEYNRKVMEADPRNIDGRVLRGFLAATVQMYDKAIAEFDGVLAEQPTHTRALTYRALVLLETGKNAEAIPALEAALAVQPGNPMLTRALAKARGDSGAPPVPAGPAEVIASGIATLPAGMEGAATGAQFVFVSLKDPKGGPPLGAVKLPPGPFPLTFEITTANLIAMGGQARPIPPLVNLAMWVDKDGNPMTREAPIGTIDGLEKGVTGLVLELK